MKLFSVRGIGVYCSLPSILLTALLLLNGEAQLLFAAFVSLCLHEACHTLTARGLGYRVCRVELLPFGFSAELEERPDVIWDELAIAAAGPLASLLLCVCSTACSAALNIKNSGLVDSFTGVNFCLAAVNMLPILPLDGGRMLRALLASGMGHIRATRTCAYISFGLALALAGLFVLLTVRGDFNGSLAIFVIFTLLGGVNELRSLSRLKQTPMFVSAALRRSGSLPVRAIAIRDGVDVADVLRLLERGQYNLIYVVDDSLHTLYTLDEAELISIIAQGEDRTIPHIKKISGG